MAKNLHNLFFSFFLGTIMVSGIALVGCQKNEEASGKPAEIKPEDFQDRLERAGQRNCSDGEIGPGIIGGTKLGAAAPLARSIVFFTNIYSDRMKTCTGSLIQQDMVLLAAHCLEQVSESSKLIVHISTDPYCDWSHQNPVTIKVDKYAVHKGYRSIENENTVHDIALLHLSRPAPETMKPLALKTSDSVVVNKSIYAIGYGKTVGLDTKDSQDPMLRFTQLNLISDSSEQKNGQKFLVADMRQGHGICQGDSGGPALVATEKGFEIAGVASFVRSNSRSTDPCQFEGYYTRIVDYLDWIEAAAKTLSRKESLPAPTP